LIGTKINERYHLKTELGQGGMGTVYRAYDTTLKRDVALKLLSNTRMGTEGRARMVREAQTVANLHHPNIVVIHDAGVYQDSPYIIMELVEGKSLHDKKPKSFGEIIEAAVQICKALEHAHQHGIIHRDLKPENVIIEPSGVLKLMDFGLARSVASLMTIEGMIVGTVDYMSPEQAMGAEIDARTDLYALGVMLYELATGVLPFKGQGAVAVISQHLNAPPVPPRARKENIPGYLNNLILKLMEKDPGDRLESAGEILTILESPEKAGASQRATKELNVLDRIVRGRMVGRQAEFEEACQLWKGTAAGAGQILFISSEPGVGKTRLMCCSSYLLNSAA